MKVNNHCCNLTLLLYFQPLEEPSEGCFVDILDLALKAPATEGSREARERGEEDGPEFPDTPTPLRFALRIKPLPPAGELLPREPSSVEKVFARL